MAYVNGVNAPVTSRRNSGTSQQIAGDNIQCRTMSPERLQKIRELLSEPFDPGEIKWRVTATSTHQTQARAAEARTIGRIRRPTRLHRSTERRVWRMGLDPQL